eukprot:g10232.t1
MADCSEGLTNRPSELAAEPKIEYERRLHDREAAALRHESLSNRLSSARGVVFLAGLALAIASASSLGVPAWTVAIPLVIFVALVIIHAGVADRWKRAKAATEYYRDGLKRLDDEWVGVGAAGERYADPLHVYSGDLDLFGDGSLFQLLSCARTRLGEDTLAKWLSAPADAETLKSRRDCVQELRDHLDLRERLALLDAEVHDDLNQNLLRAWAGETPRPLSPGYRIAALVMSAVSVTMVLGWLFYGEPISISWVLISALPLGVFTFLFRKQMNDLAETVQRAGSGLAILSQVLELYESEEFKTPALKRLRDRLEPDGVHPSRHIRRLNKLIQSLNNSLQNQFFAPIGFLLALPLHLIHAIESWRARVGPKIPEWLAAIGELEAVTSLSGYAYEHPNDPFAEITDEGVPCFEAVELGHPLIPNDQCIRNDVSLGLELQLILVSGSNMSGKSTLLRTIGANVVLALAGAPVRAKSLRISPLQLGTAMRIQDSLQDGKSLFYAVISRVKSVVELAGQKLPLLFLLDEILQGTNSHDRRVGAEGIIRKLVADNAVGLVTTHDLALTKIVESFGSKAINCHFQDKLENGKMTFDYRIRPGVVERSNALELMRMMGLDV